MYYHIPFIVQARGATVRKFGRSGLKGVYDFAIGNFIMKHAASAVALSDEEILGYKQLKVSPNRIIKVNNPFDFSAQMIKADGHVFKKKWNISTDDRIILFLARIHETKGLGLLIEAIARIGRPTPPAYSGWAG